MRLEITLAPEGDADAAGGNFGEVGDFDDGAGHGAGVGLEGKREGGGIGSTRGGKCGDKYRVGL